MTLSVMCITKLEPHAVPFVEKLIGLAGKLRAELVIGLDAPYSPSHEYAPFAHIVPVDAEGCLENVHDTVLDHCLGDYALRLDDDEQCSPAMVA